VTFDGSEGGGTLRNVDGWPWEDGGVFGEGARVDSGLESGMEIAGSRTPKGFFSQAVMED